MVQIQKSYADTGTEFDLVEFQTSLIDPKKKSFRVAGLFPPGKAEEHLPANNPTSKSFKGLLQWPEDSIDMNWSDLFLVSSLNGNNSSIRQEAMLKGAVDPVESSIRDSMFIRMLSEVALESILTHSTPVVVVGGGTNNAVLEMWEAQKLLIISPICSCVALVAVDIGSTTYHFLAVHHRKHLTACKMSHGDPQVCSWYMILPIYSFKCPNQRSI
jgi:hypothetical protein